MRHNLVSDALYVINNAEEIGSRACTVPYSKIIADILGIMEQAGYIEGFSVRKGVKKKIEVKLLGKINRTRAVNPRFSVRKGETEKWEKRFLPAKSFGILLMSTSSGIIEHGKMKEKGIGGRIVAYVY